MITYEEAKAKAAEECSGYDLLEEKEDNKFYRFYFGIKNEFPIPGMPEILIDKHSGELSFFNIFTKLQKEHINNEITFY